MKYIIIILILFLSACTTVEVTPEQVTEVEQESLPENTTSQAVEKSDPVFNELDSLFDT